MININKSYNFPIILNEQGIRRIYDEIEKLLGTGKVAFIVEYSDKSSMKNVRLEEVLNDENRASRKITEMSIYGKNNERTIYLSFGRTFQSSEGKSYFPKTYLEVSGPDRQNVFIIQSQLEDRIQTFKASHWNRKKIMWTFLGLYVTAFILLLKLTKVFSVFIVFTADGKSNLETNFSLIVIGLGVIILWGIYELFPNLTFLIGGQIERHNRLLRMRSQIFWVVIVGLIITLFGTFIFKIVV